MKTYTKQTFENYLKEYFTELNPQVLDDDLPDAFDNWLGGRDVDDIIKYGELYGREQAIAGAESAMKYFTQSQEMVLNALK